MGFWTFTGLLLSSLLLLLPFFACLQLLDPWTTNLLNIVVFDGTCSTVDPTSAVLAFHERT